MIWFSTKIPQNRCDPSPPGNVPQNCGYADSFLQVLYSFLFCTLVVWYLIPPLQNVVYNIYDFILHISGLISYPPSAKYVLYYIRPLFCTLVVWYLIPPLQNIVYILCGFSLHISGFDISSPLCKILIIYSVFYFLHWMINAPSIKYACYTTPPLWGLLVCLFTPGWSLVFTFCRILDLNRFCTALNKYTYTGVGQFP